MRSHKYVSLKLCVTLAFGLHLLSLSYLSVSVANLPATGLKKAFPDLPQPRASSRVLGTKTVKCAGPQSRVAASSEVF